MDFSNSAFNPSLSSSQLPSSLSNDTMDHAKMVMACRFGWNAGPEPGPQNLPAPQSLLPSTPLTSHGDERKRTRFTPCRGRLYHQLTCSHRIRTDIVEDCGANCLDPLGLAPGLSFYCHECVEKESSDIWAQRESLHNATYPPIEQMTNEQYEQWYEEHRLLEAQFANDRRVYDMELKSRTRPSHICSALEASKEEMDFAAEVDSLSLALVSSNDSAANPLQTRAQRISLPNDASEQLHWHLNSLALDRGSCGVEYSTNHSPAHTSTTIMNEEDLWSRPRK